MVAVNPIKTRYKPEDGDSIVGKILELGDKLWRVHINASNKAVLNLNSINLKGIQRIKTEADELSMRDYFKENDIIVAEIHTKHGGSKGGVNL
jgi:exosome complex component RRP4